MKSSYVILRAFGFAHFKLEMFWYKPPYASLVSDDGEKLGDSHMSEKWRYYTSFIGLQSNNKYLTDCIALEPLSRDVSSIKMPFNMSIFDQGIRSQYKFRVFLHYPGQLIRSHQSCIEDWRNFDQIAFKTKMSKIKCQLL